MGNRLNWGKGVGNRPYMGRRRGSPKSQAVSVFNVNNGTSTRFSKLVTLRDVH